MPEKAREVSLLLRMMLSERKLTRKAMLRRLEEILKISPSLTY
jgi:hypothetical protein